MQIINNIAEMRTLRHAAQSLAFVPTMGNLHDGHLSLVDIACQHADVVVVSIFVNRLQFGQGEDFDRYPRTFQADCDKLQAAGCHAVFAPDENELYPQPQQYFVEPPAIANELCGAHRAGHFRGVTTVVNKLFNIVQPDVAVFGKKDFQQITIIRQMVEQLAMPIEIIGGETGRADDGLALSSRNGYLSTAERAEAPRIYHNLSRIKAAVDSGRRDFVTLQTEAVADLHAHGWQVDYVEVRNAATLLPAQVVDSHLVVLAAAKLGKTRLIDNLEFRI
jgi:pantoate--beta-alanine ligase